MYRHGKDAMFRAADSSISNAGHLGNMFSSSCSDPGQEHEHEHDHLNSPFSSIKEEEPASCQTTSTLFKMEEDFYGDSDVDLNPLQHLEASTTTSDVSDEKHQNDSDANFQAAAADSNSSTPSKSFVPCKVCGDKASGYHYGVTSCEGCKGFFRRSIQKQIEYRCLRDGKCQVLRLNRNRCQFCRFKKCLAVGMSRDSVRYGRVPKCRTKNLEIKMNCSSSMSSTMTELSGSGSTLGSATSAHFASSTEKSISPDSACTPTPDSQHLDVNSDEHLAIYDIILHVTQAHVSNCFYTDDKIRHLNRHAAILSEATSSSTPDSMHMQKIIMWQNLANLINPAIQRMVEFAKRTPSFGELSQEDQLILIKGAFLEIWLIHAAKVMHHHQVTFQDGSYVSKQQLDMIFEGEFTAGMFKFAAELQQLNLHDTDLGLLSAIVLYSPDRNNLFDIKLVEQIQERLKDALKVQLTRHRTSTTSTDSFLYQNVLSKLPDLRALNSKHSERLQWYRLQYQYLSNMPPLFAEIFDIPKSDEEFQMLLASS